MVRGGVVHCRPHQELALEMSSLAIILNDQSVSTICALQELPNLVKCDLTQRAVSQRPLGTFANRKPGIE